MPTPLAHALLAHDEPSNERILRAFFVPTTPRDHAADVISLATEREARARAHEPR